MHNCYNNKNKIKLLLLLFFFFFARNKLSKKLKPKNNPKKKIAFGLRFRKPKKTSIIANNCSKKISKKKKK